MRCGYSDADLIRSQFASHLDIAQDIAGRGFNVGRSH